MRRQDFIRKEKDSWTVMIADIPGIAGLILLSLPLAALALAAGFAARAAVRRYRAAPLPPPPETAPAPPPSFPAQMEPSPRAAPAAELPAAVEAKRQEKKGGEGKEKTATDLLFAARARAREGAGAEAAAHLRACLETAARQGQKDIMALARLELGDLARAGGDLTTACEHWQIARVLFRETRDAAAGALAEARMKEYGCPTDWVLTDF